MPLSEFPGLYINGCHQRSKKTWRQSTLILVLSFSTNSRKTSFPLYIEISMSIPTTFDLLFRLCSAVNSKQIIRFFAESTIKEKDHKENRSNKSQDNKQLNL